MIYKDRLNQQYKVKELSPKEAWLILWQAENLCPEKDPQHYDVLKALSRMACNDMSTKQRTRRILLP